MAIKTIEENRKARIEELKACALGIADEAEKIYGDFKYPCSLEVVITMEPNQMPTVELRRSFVPTKLIEHVSV